MGPYQESKGFGNLATTWFEVLPGISLRGTCFPVLGAAALPRVTSGARKRAACEAQQWTSLERDGLVPGLDRCCVSAGLENTD